MQKEKNIPRKLLALFLLALMLMELLLGVLSLTARAADAVGNALGSQTVEQDLEAAGFDLSLYNKNLAADPEVMMLSELGYTEEGRGLDESFYLLVYVYNPSGLALDLAKNNTVNLGIGGKNYENCKLVCYGSSSDHLFYRFYVTRDKSFLTSARECAAAHSGTRTYSVAGIQLWNSAAEALRDNEVGKTYSFTGYAKGCHETSELVSTLRSSYTGLETISLELEHTTWRNRLYDFGLGYLGDEGVCDAISTVYFGVPKKYLEEYAGGLKQISAEWYEFKTKEIFVTWDGDSYKGGGAYGELLPWVGKTLGETYAEVNDDGEYFLVKNDHSFSNTSNDLTRRVLWKVLDATGLVDFMSIGGAYNPNAFSWKEDKNTLQYYEVGGERYRVGNLQFPRDQLTTFLSNSASIAPSMHWLFGISPPQDREDTVISSERLRDYMVEYTQKVSPSVADLALGKYALSLFEKRIDEDRVSLVSEESPWRYRGLIRQTVSADEEASTLIEADQSWWEKLWNIKQTENISFNPLYVFSANDILNVESLNPDDPEDVSSFETTFLVEDKNTSAKSGSVLADLQEMINNDLVPVLYRFAVTDYAVYNAIFDNTDDWYDETYITLYDKVNMFEGGSHEFGKIDGYVAQQTVFLDFDIISLGFDTGEQGMALKIIPVVADPIDVISGLIAPNDVPIEETEWWQKIIMLLGLILILVVFGTYLMPVFMFLWSNLMNVLYNLAKLLWKVLLWLVGLPFRLLGRIFRR